MMTAENYFSWCSTFNSWIVYRGERKGAKVSFSFHPDSTVIWRKESHQ